MGEKTWFQKVDDFVRGAANTLTFGGADYLEGAFKSLVNGKKILENIHDEHKRSHDAAHENGGEVNAYNAGSVAAMVMGTAALAKTAGAIAEAKIAAKIGEVPPFTAMAKAAPRIIADHGYATGAKGAAAGFGATAISAVVDRAQHEVAAPAVPNHGGSRHR